MKITHSQLIKIVNEELRKFLKENHPAQGKNPPHDIPADDPELTADQIASLEEPIDATADMSDEDVMRLAAALAAESESWGDEGW